MYFDSASFKISLEVRPQFGQILRCSQGSERTTGSKYFKHLREIALIVSPQIHDPAWSESLAGNTGKTLTDEPMPAMPGFRPWVGEINVQRTHRMRWQEIFKEIGRFDANSTQVG